MMFRNLLFTVVALTGFSAAQQHTSAPAPSTSLDAGVVTITKQVAEVSLVFTAVDKHGRFVTDVDPKTLELLDDNKPPAAIVEFKRQTDLPLRIELLIDQSSSIERRFRFEQEAASAFLRSMLTRPEDKASVVAFDSTVEVLQEFTPNPELLSAAVGKLRPQGTTALFDAAYYVCRDRFLHRGNTAHERRVVVIISDGDDNASRADMKDVLETADRAQVLFYAISTDTSHARTWGDKTLRELTDATGGRTFMLKRPEEVGKAFRDLESELRSQYSLTYRPSELIANGQYRKISLRLAQDNGVKVRTRRGYFAPLDTEEQSAAKQPLPGTAQ